MQPQVLVVPGYTGSGPEHWQSLWERAHPEYRRVTQRDWDTPHREEWVTTLGQAVDAAGPAAVLVAHSLGCLVVAHLAARRTCGIAGALLVAPADVERPDTPAALRDFAPVPLARLPFPSVVVASQDDPYVSFERAREFAAAWGSGFVDAGRAGHINTAAGFGPWPGGEALLAGLLRVIAQ